jgi:hypothetical protein
MILSSGEATIFDSMRVGDRAAKIAFNQKLLATLEVVDQAAGEFLLPTEMLANFEANGQFATAVGG